MKDIDPAAAFRDAIRQIGLSQSGLARTMRGLGDPRSQPTLLRSISNWCRGKSSVPGEMWVVLRLLHERPTKTKEPSDAA